MPSVKFISISIHTNVCVLFFQDWLKLWFVLSGNTLKYYKDARSEDTGPTGVIDLSSCHLVENTSVARNYGFILQVTGYL